MPIGLSNRSYSSVLWGYGLSGDNAAKNVNIPAVPGRTIVLLRLMISYSTAAGRGYISISGGPQIVNFDFGPDLRIDDLYYTSNVGNYADVWVSGGGAGNLAKINVAYIVE